MEKKAVSFKKLLLLCTFVLMMGILLIPQTVRAADGPTIYWAVDSDQNLVISNREISGGTSQSFPASTVFDASSAPWGKNIKTVKIEGAPAPQNTDNWFAGCTSLNTIDFYGINLSNCRSMKGMLDRCSALELILIGPSWHNLPAGENSAKFPIRMSLMQPTAQSPSGEAGNPLPEYSTADTGINIYLNSNYFNYSASGFHPLRLHADSLLFDLRKINALSGISDPVSLKDAAEDAMVGYNRLSDQMKGFMPADSLDTLQKAVQKTMPGGLPHHIKIRWSSIDGADLVEPITFEIPEGGITVKDFLNQHYTEMRDHFSKDGYVPRPSATTSIGYYPMTNFSFSSPLVNDRVYPNNMPDLNLNLNECSVFYFYSFKKIGTLEFTISPITCGNLELRTVKLTLSQEDAIKTKLSGGGIWPYWNVPSGQTVQVKAGDEFTIGPVSFDHAFGYDPSDLQLKINGGELTDFNVRSPSVTFTVKGIAVHDWDAGQVTTSATTTSEGVMTYKCKGCNETKTEPIPKLDPSSGGNPSAEPGNDPNQKGSDGTPVGPGASAAAAERAITNMVSDNDPQGTVFGKLALKSPKQTKTSVDLRWNTVPGASSYIIYGNRCGKGIKPVKLAVVKGNKQTVTTVNNQKVKKGTYYKFIMVALDKNNTVVSTSKVIHVATKGGKVGNHKKVTVKKSVIKKAKKLKKGKKLKLKAKAVPQSKKLKVRKHRAVLYESSNINIATVSKKGVVKAKNKGTCYIYAYAQNGVFKKIKVTVK